MTKHNHKMPPLAVKLALLPMNHDAPALDGINGERGSVAVGFGEFVQIGGVECLPVEITAKSFRDPNQLGQILHMVAAALCEVTESEGVVNPDDFGARVEDIISKYGIKMPENPNGN